MKKTIYLSDADAHIFDRALDLAGEKILSDIVVQALSNFIEKKESEADALQMVEIDIGTYSGGNDSNDITRVRFNGRKLSEGSRLHNSPHNSENEGTNWFVYKTNKGKILLHTYEWSDRPGRDSKSFYEVFNDFNELVDRTNLPGELLSNIAGELGIEYVKVLDI